MLHRFTLLLVLLQCHGPSQISPLPLEKVEASYMKYIPGAGGGRGITFSIRSSDSIPDLTVTRFEVNGIALPTRVFYRNGTTLIEASKFYVDPEMTMENENLKPIDPVLFNQDSFEAVIYFTHQGQSDSLHLRDFQEEESPLYP